MEDQPTSARSPWQNGYCERMVGTLKRECLNHMIIFNEGHACRIIRKFLEYYHDDRTHLGLGKDAPSGRAVERPALGPVRSRAILGGMRNSKKGGVSVSGGDTIDQEVMRGATNSTCRSEVSVPRSSAGNCHQSQCSRSRPTNPTTSA